MTIQPPKDYKSLWIEGEEACDYIPGVSTLTNLSELVTKAVLACVPSDKSLEGRVVSHIKEKSLLRCLVASLPVIGNFLLYLSDRRCNENLEKEYKNIQDQLGSLGLNIDQTLPACHALRSKMVADVKKNAIAVFKDKLAFLTTKIAAIATETTQKLGEINRSAKDPKTKLKDSMAAMQEACKKMTPFVMEQSGMKNLWYTWHNLLKYEQQWGDKEIFYDGMEDLAKESFRPVFAALLSPFTHFSNLVGGPNLTDTSNLNREETVQMNRYTQYSKAVAEKMNSMLINERQISLDRLVEPLVVDIGYLVGGLGGI